LLLSADRRETVGKQRSVDAIGEGAGGRWGSAGPVIGTGRRDGDPLGAPAGSSAGPNVVDTIQNLVYAQRDMGISPVEV
jgi:hypothetical protein